MKTTALDISITIVTIGLFGYSLIGLFLPEARADNMSNGQYQLKETNLNSTAGKSTNSSYKATSTTGQTAPGAYTNATRKIRAGFWYIKTIIPFAFSINQLNIDFGTLTPTNFISRTNIITVSNNSAYGYAITASENHQLLVPSSGSIIPNTTCDNGTCSPTTSAAWTNTLTYGFGYRCDNTSGADCASGFTTSTFFKQFPDASTGTAAQTVMAGTRANGNKAQITYKINISGSQAAGLYTNAIRYTAIPTF